MVVSIPEGAVERWFDDDGIMRRGFIMPDGRAFMIDRYGKTIEINVNGRQQPVIQQSQAVAVEGKQNKPVHYNLFNVIIGTILLLVGLYLVYQGYYYYSNLRLMKLLHGSGIEQTMWYYFGGSALAGIFGLFFLSGYKSD